MTLILSTELESGIDLLRQASAVLDTDVTGAAELIRQGLHKAQLALEGLGDGPLQALWELSNPSDSYTFRTDSTEVAAAVCILLGNGWYPATALDGSERKVPLLLAASQLETYFQEAFDTTADSFFHRLSYGDLGQATVVALRSLLIGRAEEREALDRELARMPRDERESFVAKRHDLVRTSLTNIGQSARDIADGLEQKLKQPPPDETPAG